MQVRIPFHSWSLGQLLLGGAWCFLGSLSAHECFIQREDGSVLEVRDPEIVDEVRTNLVRTFDDAAFHHLPGSRWRGDWRSTQEELVEMVKEIQTETHLEFRFSDPGLICVEMRHFQIKRLWVTLRESDGATFAWTLETTKGKLVRLGGIEGTINRAIAALYLELLERPFEDDPPPVIEPGLGYDHTVTEPVWPAHQMWIRSHARGLERIDDRDDQDIGRQLFTYAFDLAQEVVVPDGIAGKRSPQEWEAFREEVALGEHLRFTFGLPVPIQVSGRSYALETVWIGVDEDTQQILHWLIQTTEGEWVELDGIPDPLRKKCEAEFAYHLSGEVD
ncbi:MAG: hypothetical protein AAGJ31_03025 [Verrucomicrobiota bacterium]